MPAIDVFHPPGVVWLDPTTPADAHLPDASWRREVVHDDGHLAVVLNGRHQRRIESAREPESAFGEDEPEAAEHRGTGSTDGSDLGRTERLRQERLDIERRTSAHVHNVQSHPCAPLAGARSQVLTERKRSPVGLVSLALLEGRTDVRVSKAIRDCDQLIKTILRTNRKEVRKKHAAKAS